MVKKSYRKDHKRKYDSFTRYWWAVPIAVVAGVALKGVGYAGKKAYELYQKRQKDKKKKEAIPEGGLEKTFQDPSKPKL